MVSYPYFLSTFQTSLDGTSAIYVGLVRQHGGLVPSSGTNRTFVMKDFDANEKTLKACFRTQHY